jgi:hypothetical protein
VYLWLLFGWYVYYNFEIILRGRYPDSVSSFQSLSSPPPVTSRISCQREVSDTLCQLATLSKLLSSQLFAPTDDLTGSQLSLRGEIYLCGALRVQIRPLSFDFKSLQTTNPIHSFLLQGSIAFFACSTARFLAVLTSSRSCASR